MRASDLTLFSGNEIDHFGDDGIDYAANNLAITKNYVHDNFNVGDDNHEDGMQGVIGALPAGVASNNYQGILMDSNEIIRQTDPNLRFPTGLQGIDVFDFRLDLPHRHQQYPNNYFMLGIGFASVHGGLIANNTVVNDGLLPNPVNLPA